MSESWEAYLDVSYSEPCYVPGPDEAHFFMGAQVGWSPEREAQPERDCPLCRGELTGSYVCAKCLSWGHDNVLSQKILEDYRRRGTIEPVEVRTVEGYPFPIPASEIDPRTGRPTWEA